MPVHRDDDFDAVLDGLRTEFSEGVEDVAEAALAHTQRNWRSGRDARGRPWLPNAPATIETKGHDRPNIDTGATLNSGFITRQGPFSVALGFGGQVGWLEWGTENAPARPVVRPMKTYLRHDAFRSQLARRIQRYLAGIETNLDLGGFDP